MYCQAQAFQKTDSGLKTSVQSVDIEIQFYSPSIVRVLKSPQGKTFKKESLSVIKSPEKTVLTSKQEGDVLALKSKILQVKLNVKTGAISFYDLKGDALLNEKSNGVVFTPFNDAGNPTFSVLQL